VVVAATVVVVSGGTVVVGAGAVVVVVGATVVAGDVVVAGSVVVGAAVTTGRVTRGFAEDCRWALVPHAVVVSKTTAVNAVPHRAVRAQGVRVIRVIMSVRVPSAVPGLAVDDESSQRSRPRTNLAKDFDADVRSPHACQEYDPAYQYNVITPLATTTVPS
jgi:hypothetical protein